MTNQDDKISQSITALLSRNEEVIWVRLNKIVEKRVIDGTNASYNIYTIKKNADGTYMLADLIDYLVCRVVDYAIPKSERDRAKKLDEKENTTRHSTQLTFKALKLFNELPKTGEGGELLLYVLTVDILRLPLIINKMSLKTSPKVHYQGADGIHVGYDSKNKTMSLYWCEAKMYKSFSRALRECLDSVEDLICGTGTLGERNTTDLNLVVSNLDKNITDREEVDLWLQFFDKEHPNSNNLKHAGICFIGFDSKGYSLSEQSDATEIGKAIKYWDQSLNSEMLKRSALKNHDIHIFIMPIKSVSDFRSMFLNKIGM